MYTFSSKLKTFSFVLMLVGILGIGYGFWTAPKDIQEVEQLLKADSHGGHHEATSTQSHDANAATTAHDTHATAGHDAHADAEHKAHLDSGNSSMEQY